MRSLLAWVGVQMIRILPHHFLSRIVMRATRVREPWFKDLLTRRFVAAFRPSMEDAAVVDPHAYDSFNAFFTRALQPGARPLPSEDAEDVLISPVDGTVSQAGDLDGDTVLQAKGRSFSLDALLGGDGTRAAHFVGGSFATLYLAPRDYHRIHCPVDGTITAMTYVPGRLFSVNAASARHVDQLFARNERVICYIETDHGPAALVMVGALFVGSMETVWAGQVAPSRDRRIRTWHYGDGREPTPELARGDELGRFNMGSTVILLFPPGMVGLDKGLVADARVRMGQEIGRFMD